VTAELPDARQQAALFWPQVWIYVGLSAAIRNPGDILPFTIAGAGLHIERLVSGALEARLNRAQQGGCLVIPQQCHGGRQVRCPQSACAFSRDRLATIDAATPERDRLLWQFVGSRPDRLARVAVREGGGFILIRMIGDDGDGETIVQDCRFDVHESWWVEAATPWHDLAHLLVLAAMEEDLATSFHFPNLILLGGKEWHAAIILQPLGPDLTRCRVSCAGAGAEGRQAVARLINQGMRQSGQASARYADMEPGLSLQHAILHLAGSPSASPFQRPTHGRVNPSYGFIGA
jgi:hypothetical protein